MAHDGQIRFGGLSRRKKHLLKCLDNDAYQQHEWADALFACLSDEGLWPWELTLDGFLSNGLFVSQFYEALSFRAGFDGLAKNVCDALAFGSGLEQPSSSAFHHALDMGIRNWLGSLRKDFMIRCKDMPNDRMVEMSRRLDAAFGEAYPRILNALSTGEIPRRGLTPPQLDLDAPLVS